MRKFFVLVKKELKELMTLQMIIPLLISMFIFILMGQVIGNISSSAETTGEVIFIDQDKSETSYSIYNELDRTGINITLKGQNVETALEDAKKLGISAVVEIPKGFEEGIKNGQPQEIHTYSIIRSFSITGNTGDRVISTVISKINNFLSNQLINEKIEGADPEALKNPIIKNDWVVINNKYANVNPNSIMGFVMSQSIFIPVIMFMIIIYSSTMLVTTIAAEKENKTMETLLSTPINRSALVGSKMVAAAIVALLFAAIYMVGFSYYMDRVTGGNMQGAGEGLTEAIKVLGLSLSPFDYVLLGLSFFMSILTALALSTVLGAFAEDVKKAQSLIQPVVFLVMIPYLLIMFVDVNTASLPIKLLIYAIPFSHPFMVSPNLFFNQYLAVILGILYQLLLFVVLIVIATRIFSSDGILTMKLKSRSKGKAR